MWTAASRLSMPLHSGKHNDDSAPVSNAPSRSAGWHESGTYVKFTDSGVRCSLEMIPLTQIKSCNPNQR